MREQKNSLMCASLTDGVLTFQQTLAKNAPSSSHQRWNPVMASSFQQQDANKRGQLDWQELQQHHQQHLMMGGTLDRHPQGSRSDVFQRQQSNMAAATSSSSSTPYSVYHTCERQQKKKVTIMEDNNTESSV